MKYNDNNDNNDNKTTTLKKPPPLESFKGIANIEHCGMMMNGENNNKT